MLLAVLVPWRADAYDAPVPTDGVATLADSAHNDVLDAAAAKNVQFATFNDGGSVTAEGAFTYTIPIQLPSGIKGVQPNIALVYSSQSKNGIAGVGWSLAGVPTIERVDGGDGINFIANHDTFAFNPHGAGSRPDPRNRLVALAASAPGAEAGSYHTAYESWMNFTPHGMTCGGPCAWVATDGKGNTYTFGGSYYTTVYERDNGSGATSKTDTFKARGIVTWGLTAFTDFHGNSYTVEYLPYSYRDYNVQLLVSKITYTHNAEGGLSDSTLREVSFSYEKRNDPLAAYLFPTRLKTITVKAAGSVIRSYSLTYEPDPSPSATYRGRSRLSRVQEYGTDGSTAAPPYEFTYKDPLTVPNALTFPGYFTLYPDLKRFVGDLNGDGFADLVLVSTWGARIEIQYALGGPSGLSSTIQHTDMARPARVDGQVFVDDVFMTDVNGDGLRDLVLFLKGTKINNQLGIATYVAYGDRSGLLPLVQGPTWAQHDGTLPFSNDCQNWDVAALDFNGDQRADFILACTTETEQIEFMSVNGDASGLLPFRFEGALLSGIPAGYTPSRLITGDFNGDNKSDVAVSFWNSDTVDGKMAVMLGSEIGYGHIEAMSVQAAAPLSRQQSIPIAVDINGDGCTDLMYPDPSGRVVFGSSLPDTPLVVNDYVFPTFKGARAEAMDVNGDGILDVVTPNEMVIYGASNGWLTAASAEPIAGQEYDKYSYDVPSYFPYDSKQLFPVADLNGDGTADLVRLSGDTFSTFVSPDTGYPVGGYDQWIGYPLYTYSLGTADNDGYASNSGLAGSGISLGGGGEFCDLNLSDGSSYCDYIDYATGDFNGDGIDDVVTLVGWASANLPKGSIGQSLSSGEQADMLATAKNGYGGLTTITYEGAAQFVNAVGTRPPAPPPSPVGSAPNGTPRSLVASVVKNNGRGQDRTTTYDYTDGYYLVGKRFDDTDLGFASTTVKDVELGTTVETVYRMDPPLQRLPLTRTVTSTDGSAAKNEVFTYQAVPADAYLTAATEPVSSTPYVVLSGHTVSYAGHSYEDTTTYDHFAQPRSRTHCEDGVCTYSYTWTTNDTTNWLLGRTDIAESYDAPATSGSQHVLSKTAYSYLDNGFDLAAQSSVLCDDADACTCVPGRLTSCGSTARWVDVETNRTYDAFGNLWSSFLPNHSVVFGYDGPSGQVTSKMTSWTQFSGIVFARSLTHAYSYDGAGRMLTDIDEDRHTTVYHYDALNRVSSIDHPSGATDWYLFANLGTIATDARASQAVIKVSAATGHGPPTGEGRAFGQWDAQYFDGFGTVYTEQRNADYGDVVTLGRRDVYSSSGHVVYYTRPELVSAGASQHEYEIDYDAAGRATSAWKLKSGTRTDALGQYEYIGAKLKETDANGKVVTTTFNSHGLPLTRVDAVGTTTYHYDSGNRVRRIDLPNNTLVGLQYDSWSRRKSLTDPLLGTLTFGYDDVGNLITKTEVNRDRTTTFAYDGANRATSETTPEGVARLFYGMQHLDHVTDQAGTLQLGYDGAGNLTSKTLTFNDLPTAQTVSYEFDYLGRRTKKTFPDGTYVQYRYWDDANLSNNLREVDVNGLAVATYSNYDASGRVRHRQTSAGSTDYTYDDFGILSELDSTSASGKPLQALTYTPDVLGNIQLITDHRPSTLVNDVDTSETQSFGYDDAYRLHTATGVYGSRTYEYDEIGTIRQKGATIFTFNGEEVIGKVGAAQVSDAMYDGSGHLSWKIDAQQNRWDYTFDTDGRLTAVRRNNAPWLDAIYDHSGQRRKKVFHAPTGETITTYYLDGWELRQSSASSAQTVTDHIDALNLGLITSISTGGIPGEPLLSQIDAAVGQPFSGDTTHGPAVGTYYYFANQIGSTSAITDSAGNELTRIVHEPFGEIEDGHSVGLDATTYKYSGAEVDDETALVDFGARYYDPVQARFISADDQLPGKGTTAQSFGRYTYAFDNPIKYRDPTGHEPTLITAGVGAFIGGILGAGLYLTNVGLGYTQWDANEFWATTLGGATTGFLAGLTLGGSLVADMLLAGNAGVMGYGAHQWYLGQPMTNDGVAASFTTGALIGGAFSAGGRALAPDAFGPTSTGAGGERAAVGGKNLNLPGDKFGLYASRAQSLPGYTDYVIHGSPDDFSLTQYGPDVTHRAVANAVRKDSAWDGGPIRLIACSSGACGATAAQNLANKLGVEVPPRPTTSGRIRTAISSSDRTRLRRREHGYPSILQ